MAERWSLAFAMQLDTADNVPERDASQGQVLVRPEIDVFV